MGPHPVKRLAICSLAAVLPVVLAAVPASATVTPLSTSNFHASNFNASNFNGGAPQKLEMGFFEQWGIYGRGFTLASADHEGEIADLTDLDYAFGGVEPSGALLTIPPACWRWQRAHSSPTRPSRTTTLSCAPASTPGPTTRTRT